MSGIGYKYTGYEYDQFREILKRKSEEPSAHSIDNMAMTSYGRTRTEAHQMMICVKCGLDAVMGLRTVLDIKEYTLSGYCAKCQDVEFGPPPYHYNNEYDNGSDDDGDHEHDNEEEGMKKEEKEG